MPLAKGVSKLVAYKKETTFGTLAGASSGKYIRRVTSDFNLEKETYESNEIRGDRQLSDYRHGVRSASGAINGELAPSSYSDFIQSALARDFASVTAIASLSVTIATSGSNYTITRASGSWISDGLYVGSIVRLTGAGLNTANVSNPVLVLTLSATVATVKVLSSTALVAEGPIASVTATVTGKQTYAPLTSHTDDSYTVEEWYSDIAQSEVYTGMKVGSVAVQLPSTGLTTVDISLMGKDRAQTGTSQYFSTPTAAGTNGIFAAVNGALCINGTPVAIVTSADFTIERATENATVVGSNSLADIFTGRIRVNGNFSSYFQDATIRDMYDNESTVTLIIALTTDNTKTCEAMSFVFPKIKVNSAQKADGENGIVQSHSFTALLNSVTTAGLPATTMLVQDTAI